MSDGHVTIPPDDHDHDHGHAHDHHHHHHPDQALPVVEEPLDPASQSLADALRSSFRVLKLIMVGVLILFLFSGVFTVNNNEVVVLSRFGKQIQPPYEPGLHFAWPYPIDTISRVNVGQKTAEIEDFWIRLTDADKTKDLSQASGRTGGLDPATDGAVITGDQALMHVLLQIQYHVTNANDYVKNVSDEPKLIRTLVQQSTIAEAARSTLDGVWMGPAQLVPGIRSRAQALLDSLGSGIIIENLTIEKSHYPLQVREDFMAVSDAENRMRTAVQTANKEREDKLKGAAGEAWDEINQQIERLDQTRDQVKRTEIIDHIGTLLMEKATGEAGRKIKLAEGERDRIVAEAHASADRFTTMLGAYRQSPEIVMQKLRQDMLQKVFSQPISTWVLPPGMNKFFLLNKNPDEIRQQERDAIKKKAGVGR